MTWNMCFVRFRRIMGLHVLSSGNITKNSEISIRDIHKAEASGRSLVADDFSRICLILSKLMKINSRESICEETRQGICNNIAFSFDMMHVCGEFSKGKG